MPKKKEPLIELKNVTKIYNQDKPNEFKALKSVELKIYPGEFVAIMGASGSGKTTLMNIIGALDVPTNGTYYLSGENVSSFNDAELASFRNRDVGFVFQQFNLLPRTTVLENVLLPTLYGSLPEDRNERAMEVLGKVGLQEKAGNRTNQLSGGQIQRVAIARALMMHPAIILADEPTGNLDTKTAHEVMDIFTKLNKEGNTIIIVTHEPDIASYAGRTIKVKDGEIV